MSATVAPLTATVLGVGASRATRAWRAAINNAVSRVAGLLAIAALGAVVTASFQSRLTSDLAGKPLSAAGRVAVVRVREHPLVTQVAYAPVGDRATLHAAAVDASVSAFKLAMEVGAALAIVGGLVSLGGIERRRPEAAAPVASAPEPAPV